MLLSWHGYVKPKYREKTTYVTWMRFLLFVKTENIMYILQRLLK